MRRSRGLSGRSGFVLVTALLITSISAIILIPYVSGVMADLKLTSVVNNSAAALDLAEAGAERAIWEISYNGATADFTIPVSSLGAGEYEAEVDFPASGSSVTIKSYGYVPDKASYLSRKIVIVDFSLQRAFRGAVTSLNSITMSGQASTDSYDSDIGGYGEVVDGEENIGAEGDIAANGQITLGSKVEVNGDANPGADYPFTGTPPVTGSYGTLAAPIEVDDIALPTSIATDNDNDNILITNDDGETTAYSGSTDVVLASKEILTLPGGTYYLTSLTMSGQSQILVTGALGPAIVYIDSSASLTGGKVDVNITGQGISNIGVPADLQIYYTGDYIKLAGQASFTGTIYAPDASVTLSGQSDVYGSIVCGSNVDSGQAAIHYDTALDSIMPPFVLNKVSSWQEVQQ